MTWWALAMTFGSLPGMCFVAYCFQCGHQDTRIRFVEFAGILRRVYAAKKEAIRDTGLLLAGEHAAVLAFIIAFLLFCVATDTMMLLAVNASAIPVGALSYHLGRRHRAGVAPEIEGGRRPPAPAHGLYESPFWKPIVILMLVWALSVACLLMLARALFGRFSTAVGSLLSALSLVGAASLALAGTCSPLLSTTSWRGA